MRALSHPPASRRRTWPVALLAGGLAASLSLLAPTAAQASTPSCDDHLVTHTPTGTEGDGTAVAITSQAVDADQPGWLHAGWQAAEGTELTAVHAVTIDEEVVSLAPEATGFVEDVLSLTFCGSAATPDVEEDARDDDAQEDDDAEDTDTSQDTTEDSGDDSDTSQDTDTAADGGGTTTRDDGQTTTTESASGTGSDDGSADGGGTDDPAPTASFEVAAELPASDLRDDPEVEVLSVTMARAEGDAAADTARSDARSTAQSATPAATDGGVSGPTVTVMVTGVLLALAALTVADWQRTRRLRQEVR